jgi:sugar transferase (PEP-CTERM/EpsH1 system associated)
MTTAREVHIAHVVYRFDVGGLENGVVNLINRLPDGFRHSIVCLTDYTEFAARVRRKGVAWYALGKQPGIDLSVYPKALRLLRQLAPDVVHTRNLAALECQLAAWFAGIKVRVHGEHGRDVGDLDGSNRKYQWIRRLHRPVVSHYVAVSRDLQRYLEDAIGVPPRRISQIYNGVDSVAFRPADGEREPLPQPGFAAPGSFVIGTVGRVKAVKDQTTLAHAFVHLCAMLPDWKDRLRLVLIGDGPLRGACEDILRRAGIDAQAWLPGERDDIPGLMRAMDVFVLPSLAEGISNTILEAMASGLPVVATRVGGNAELVVDGLTGTLVRPADPLALAQAIRAYVEDPGLRLKAGREARARVQAQFSMDAMVERYLQLYQHLLDTKIVQRQSLETI